VSRQGWPASAGHPQTAEQLEQQQLEEGQKFKQQGWGDDNEGLS